MELPQLGKQCLEPTCNKLDFLPMKCDACEQIFCNDHYFYLKHNCPSAYKKDVQVPVCPLCNTLIPVPRNQLPDVAVGAHIDNDCQSDPAKTRRKAYINKCSNKGCKIKEIVPVLCPECKLNFCLKHRHTTDHRCQGKGALHRQRAANTAELRQKSQTAVTTKNIQGNMSEDEALARALQLSMQDSVPVSQVESDQALARALQESEQRQRNTNRRQTAGNGDKSCEIS